MHIDHLVYLVTAIDEGSLTEASKKLHVTNQAISKAIKDMERHFGRSIIVREGRGISPTALGRELAALARPVVDGYRDFEDFGMSYIEDGEAAGTLRVAIPVTFCRGELFHEKRLDLFRVEFPEIVLELLRNTPDNCLKALDQGLADASVCIGRCDREDYYSVRIDELGLRVLVHQDNPLAPKKAIELEEAVQSSIALPEDMRYVLPRLEKEAARARCDISFKMVAPSMKEHLDFLAQGGLVLVGPHSPLVGEGTQVLEKPLTSNGRESLLPVYLVYPRTAVSLSLSHLQSVLSRARH